MVGHRLVEVGAVLGLVEPGVAEFEQCAQDGGVWVVVGAVGAVPEQASDGEDRGDVAADEPGEVDAVGEGDRAEPPGVTGQVFDELVPQAGQRAVGGGRRRRWRGAGAR